MGRLERKLDQGLINKILSGWKPEPGRTLSTRSMGVAKPKSADRYRAAMRNWALRKTQMGRKVKRGVLRSFEYANQRRTRSVCRPGWATAPILR